MSFGYTVLGFGSGISEVSYGAIEATGGTETEVGIYKYHTFNSSDDFIVTATGTDSNTLQYLVIAGGGGSHWRGAGGAGGYRTGEASASVQTYSIVIGAGGRGMRAASPYVDSANGYTSSGFGLSNTGGGRATNNGAGASGGSGGGASASAAGGAGTAGQGNAGGSCNSSSYGAGGGGAGAVGESPTSHLEANADGGAGLAWLDGTYRAGGGGGSGSVYPYSYGGQGGGGRGGGNTDGGAGGTNTGSGGGGSGNSPNSGAWGGSGVVIVRYQIAAA